MHLSRIIGALLLPVLLACHAAPAFALIVDGKEVEDIYKYILEALKVDAQKQEQYRIESKRNPNYRGYRPYAYSSLTHLSAEDLIYGAVQGGLTAMRDLGPNATQQQIAAQAEANIQRVMEMFPMLTTDFKAGEALLKRMTTSGKKDYFQQFLLRRCRPGFADDSLFAAFWRDELKRDHKDYVHALEVICDDAFSDEASLLLALRVYTATVQEDYEKELSSDPAMAQLTAAGQAPPSAAQVLADDALRGQLADPEGFMKRTRALAKARARLDKQQEADLRRSEPVKELAKSLLADLDARYPALAAINVTEEPKPPAPQPTAPMPDAAAEPAESDSPPESNEPPAGFPKLGIPTLKGF